MRKDFSDEFCREFTKEMNRLRMEQRAALAEAMQHPEVSEASMRGVIDAIVLTPEQDQLRIELRGNLANDLSKFTETVEIAKRAHGIIQFNFVGTLAVDAVGVGLAAFGLLSPLLAAFIHVTSELTLILNSARLLPSRTTAPPLAKPAALASVTQGS